MFLKSQEQDNYYALDNGGSLDQLQWGFERNKFIAEQPLPSCGIHKLGYFLFF